MATEITKGFKTSEFWLSAAAILIGLLTTSGVLTSLPEDSWVVKMVGLIVAGLAALGYSAARAKTKTGGQ